MLTGLYQSLIGLTEKIHDPKRRRVRVLSRRTFARALALVAFGGVARPASPRVRRPSPNCDDVTGQCSGDSDARSPLGASQEPILRGDVDWVIGGVLDGDPAYLFDEVRALAQDAEGRVYVLDSGFRTVRVFEHRGGHLYSIGGPGEGPGEFRIRHLCGLALDPDGRLWVNQLISFEIFEVGADGGAYFGSLVVRDGATAALCGNPMFAGPTGITVPRRGRSGFGDKNEHVQVTLDGTVWGRVANFRTSPDFGEWEWPTAVVQDPSEGPRENFITPPFAARIFVASAPDGGFATAFSPVYDIGVHGPDGTEKTRLRRELLGPVITDGRPCSVNSLLWISYGILWVVVLVLGAGMIVMLREHADLLLGSSEGRSRLHGPPEGATAPGLAGEEAVLAATATERPRVVLFMAVTCDPCWRRIPQVSHFAADQAEAVETLVCCSGPVERVREFAGELGPEVSVIADPAGDAAASWRVYMTPFAVGVDRDGIVRGKVANPAYDNLTLLSRLIVAGARDEPTRAT